MTRSLKAALLSAFIYPGAGQIFLKRYPLAFIFIGIATVSFYIIISNMLKMASHIVEGIQSGQVSPDFSTVLALLTESSNTDLSLINNATTAVVLTWFISIIHAYLIGKAQEKSS